MIDATSLRGDDMFRIYCPSVARTRLVGIESLRELVTTSRGPVAYVDCDCGALVLVESGNQTWHGAPGGSRHVA
jgi:hypothetical protein